MDIVRCEKGHFYDASEHPSCPTCAAEVNGVGVTGAPGVEPISPTEPVKMDIGGSGIEPISPTEPAGAYGGPIGAVPETVPVTPDFNPSDFVPNNNIGGIKVEPIGPTQPVWPGGRHGFNPVTGWFVCVDGPDKGTDYRIYSEINYIGRGQHMDICIKNDDHVSQDKHAQVAYDPETHLFYFGPGIGKNLVRLNGKPVLSQVELKAYDVVTIGTTKLCFVPFCTEKFNWSE